LIGGFFFLRFINPAIVTPQAYMLIDSLPTSAKHPRRTLTLIAKMLQNLANKPSYAKEQYMLTLNPFVEANKARINQFLNALCDVGDFYETLEVSFQANLFMYVNETDVSCSDGPIYGVIQERPAAEHHSQRNLQYTVAARAACRRTGR
jgi:hypothetical protein